MFRSFFLSRRWALWAWGGLLVLVALVFITVQQTVKLNAWYGEFYDLLQKPEQAGGLEKFWGFMLQFAWIAFPFMLLRSLETYLASHFAFRWRQALTEEYLPRWQGTEASVEGASQRIQEDCMRFARQTENLGLGLVRAVLTLLSFIPILWALSTGMAFCCKLLRSVASRVSLEAITWRDMVKLSGCADRAQTDVEDGGRCGWGLETLLVTRHGRLGGGTIGVGH